MRSFEVHVGRHLRQHQAELSQAIIGRLLQMRPDLHWEHEGGGGDAPSSGELSRHIEFLSQAISVGTPELFNDYVEWFGDVSTSRGVDGNEFREAMEAATEVLRDLLPLQYYEVVRKYLKSALQTISLPEREAALSSSRLDPPAREYLDELLSGNIAQSRKLIEDARRTGRTRADLCLKILQPVQHEIGLLWQKGIINIAREHYCTAEVQACMARLKMVWQPPEVLSAADHRPARKFIAACVAHEQHDVGLRMMGDFLEESGWEVHYLGANTPTEAIVSHAAEVGQAVVGLSATIAIHVEHAAHAIRALARNPRCSAAVLVGGRPFNLVTDLWQRIGADGVAMDAQLAVQTAEELLRARTGRG